MNNNCIYFVEGDCEAKLINALKQKPELLLPGKVIVLNLIQNYIPKSRLLSITPDTKVVFVFDTDKDETKYLKKNIEYIKTYCQKSKLIFLPQVLNLEDDCNFEVQVLPMKEA